LNLLTQSLIGGEGMSIISSTLEGRQVVTPKRPLSRDRLLLGRGKTFFPLLGRLMLVEFSVIVIKTSFPPTAISFSCVGVLQRTVQPSGSRYLKQGTCRRFSTGCFGPCPFKQTRKISGFSSCPSRNKTYRFDGTGNTLLVHGSGGSKLTSMDGKAANQT